MYIRRPQASYNLHPAALGEHPIDDEEIEGVLQGAPEADAAVAGHLCDMPLPAQDPGKHPGHLLLIFYDQDTRHIIYILVRLPHRDHS